MDRIRCLFKMLVPAEEYDRTVNPGAAHHAAHKGRLPTLPRNFDLKLCTKILDANNEYIISIFA